jgi:hypothetical protein
MEVDSLNGSEEPSFQYLWGSTADLPKFAHSARLAQRKSRVPNGNGLGFAQTGTEESGCGGRLKEE